MHNPWQHLPQSRPFVLPDDSAPVAALNTRESETTKYDLDLFPEPFFGRPDAPVVVLTLNPGWHETDAALHASVDFASLARQSLSHSLDPYPVLHLQPGMQTLGARYWNQKARPLIEAAGFDTVAKNLLCIQYFPYHSKEYRPSPAIIPSQLYGFALVRGALARGADVVLMRSRRLWSAAVPELNTYSRLHMVRNPRNPALSFRNLGEASFSQVLARLQASA